MPSAKTATTENKPPRKRKAKPRLNGKSETDANPKAAGRPHAAIDLRQVETLAAQGLSQKQICLALGVAESTFIDNKRRVSEISDALERGKAKGIALVSGVLMEAARAMQPWAVQMYLKTQAREQFGDVQRTELTGKDGAPLPAQDRVVVTKEAMDSMIQAFDKSF